MAEPQHEITVRCEPCHDRGRRASALAIVVPLGDPWLGCHWRVWAPGPRVPPLVMEAARTRPGSFAARGERAVEGGQPLGMPMPLHGRAFFWVMPPQIGDAVQLACRQCRNQPRPKLRGLYRDAFQALDEGRREIYR